MPLSEGQTINHDRYRIESLLGQGGMGAVYRAWDTTLDVPVAIKENLDASTVAQKQFSREANILARLSHPNLPRVTDYFFIPGQGQYLVMDFVDGEDLQSMLDRLGKLPEPQVLSWIAQICEALAYLHSQPNPIIHRDIKPANIRIRPDGHAMLVDFGIAKIYDPHLATTVGAKAVTPGYSPPEQYGGGSTDSRSDIYALGATLYHLLTGEAPPESVQRMVKQVPLPPPHQYNERITPEVEQAILKSVEIATDRRFQTVDEFRRALTTPALRATVPVTPEAIGGNRISPVHQPQKKQPPRRSNLVLVALAIVSLLVVLCLAGLLLGGKYISPALVEIGLLPGNPASPLPVTQVQSSPPTPPATDVPTLIPSPSTDTPVPTSPPLPLSPLGVLSQGWSMGGGNPSNSSWNAAERQLFPPLSPVWTWNQVENFNIETLTTAFGILFLGGAHQDNDNAVYAVEIGKDNPLWSYSMTDARGGNQVHVAIGEKMAFFGGQQDDNLYSADVGMGTILFSVPGMDSLYSRSPKVSRGVVYVPGSGSSGDGMLAIDAISGKEIWRADVGRIQSDNAVWDPLVIAGGSLNPGDGTIDTLALETNNGQVLWRTRQARIIKVVTDGNLVFTVISANNTFGPFDTAVAYNYKDGSPVWQHQLEHEVWFFTEMAVTEELVIIAGSKSNSDPQWLVVLDKNNGTLLHSIDIPGLWTGGLAVANGVLYVGTNRELHAYNLADFNLLWQEYLPVNDLAVSDGYLFVATATQVRAFRKVD